VQFAKLSRTLGQIAKEYSKSNVSWDGFSGVLAKAQSGEMLQLSQGMLDFLTPFIEQAPTILAISCKADAEKLESLSYTDGVIAVLLVLKANLEHLNRFFVTLVAPQSEAAATTVLTAQ
jgi:hypothetical protein